MRRIALPVTVSALLAMAAPVAAQMQDWPAYADDVGAEVSRLVAEIELFRMSEQMLAVTASLAYQEGVAVICPGFATDEGKRVGFLAQFVPMQDAQFRTASTESMALRSEVMFAFGAHFGATLAMGRADPAAFCARAESRRDDAGLVAPIWLPEG